MADIVHLLSGGLDSVTMLYDLQTQGYQIYCLLFDYGQAHKQELKWAVEHTERLHFTRSEIIHLPSLGGLTEKSWVVPNRNAIFLGIAVNTAIRIGAETVTIGCNKDDADYFPDCRQIFLDSVNASVKAAGYDVQIKAPYIDKMKWEIGDLARQFGIKPNEIWTCYHGGSEPCGECPACKKLELAFP